jgi:hypothetical protein
MFLDTTIVKLSILNQNTQTSLPLNLAKREKGNDGFDYLQFYNKDKSEILILTLLPEAPISLVEYTMYYAPSDHSFANLQATLITHFVSGKGIRLGLSKRSVLKILGSPSEIDSTTNRIYYRNDDPQSVVLSRYGAKEYLAWYRFRNSRLFEVSVQLFLREK